MLSSNVVGLDIYNGQNNKIGKIQDIAFDSSKQITGYILSVGGFLGNGHALCRGQSKLAQRFVRRPKQDLAGEHERDQSPAEGGAGVQIRRPVDGQPELSRKATGRSLDASSRPDLEQAERACPTRRQTSIVFGR